MAAKWQTREVAVGSVGVGGGNPIRIQSMTTSNTRDIGATIGQILRLADAGCEIVRVTVQGMKEAEACEGIKNGLLQRGYTIPLVADIHFFPPAAIRVIDFVDKVRINPGNYADKRASFKTVEYDDTSYAKEIEKIEERFSPLVEKCKSLKRAMRIGVNHGSLSDRIMNRYGDTPNGMVESALEFARICRKNAYHEFMFSMKSSNPRVMILAYRLLVSRMMTLGWNYPLHLGVTEAGEGEDGRVKSAMGIGSLLLEGIGDTIRVSLTEDPWDEIDPCRRLIALVTSHERDGLDAFEEARRPMEFQQRHPPIYPDGIKLHRDGAVVIHANAQDLAHYDTGTKQSKCQSTGIDGLVLEAPAIGEQALQVMRDLVVAGTTFFSSHPQLVNTIPILSLQDALTPNGVPIGRSPVAVTLQGEPSEQWDVLAELRPALIFLAPAQHRLRYARYFFDWLTSKHLLIPVILSFDYATSREDLIMQSAAEYGALLCDGLGDGIWIRSPHDKGFLHRLSLTILQAARMRMSKTDFISCPSCGRTLFDLQKVSRGIRLKTAHLPGVKIAIMGCIVNGPGEMADADFGYVGSKPGKIDLYVGKNCVEKDVDAVHAEERLIDLLKTHGRWIDPVD